MTPKIIHAQWETCALIRWYYIYAGSWINRGKKSWKDYVRDCVPEFLFFWNNKRKRKYFKIKER